MALEICILNFGEAIPDNLPHIYPVYAFFPRIDILNPLHLSLNQVYRRLSHPFKDQFLMPLPKSAVFGRIKGN